MTRIAKEGLMQRTSKVQRQPKYHTLHEDVRLVLEADVAVVGGGLSGVVSAIAAARNGANVVLIERDAFLGANATTGLPLLSFHDIRGNRVIDGLPQEIISRLEAMGGSVGPIYCPLTCSIVIVDSEKVKELCLQMLEEAHVTVLLDTTVTSVVLEGSAIKRLVIDNIDGRRVIESNIVIDASGDAVVAVAAGAAWTSGDDSTGAVQPPTLMFRMSGVNTEKLRRGLAAGLYQSDISKRFFAENEHFWVVGFRDQIEQAKNDGVLPESFPMETAIFGTLLQEGDVAVNMAKVAGVNCSIASDLISADIEARRLVPTLTEFFLRYIPGFEQARVTWIAHRIGIRETRRIVGHYILQESDLMKGVIFQDSIALGGYMVDVHPASGGSATYTYPKAYGIPYRALIPQGVDNLLVVGRCISASHEALGSTRVMVIGMAVGQAAGTAAAICCEKGTHPLALDVGELQRKLVSQGVMLAPVPEFDGYSPYA